MSEAEEKALRKLATIEAPFQVWSLLDSMFSMISSCVSSAFHSYSVRLFLSLRLCAPRR